MRNPSFLLALALSAQLAAPAWAAAPAGLPARRAAAAGEAAIATLPAPRSAGSFPTRVVRRDGGTLAHISVGCATSPRRVPRPVVVIIPTIAIVVISVCITPQDIFRVRRG